MWTSFMEEFVEAMRDYISWSSSYKCLLANMWGLRSEHEVSTRAARVFTFWALSAATNSTSIKAHLRALPHSYLIMCLRLVHLSKNSLQLSCWFLRIANLRLLLFFQRFMDDKPPEDEEPYVTPNLQRFITANLWNRAWLSAFPTYSVYICLPSILWHKSKLRATVILAIPKKQIKQSRAKENVLITGSSFQSHWML